MMMIGGGTSGQGLVNHNFTLSSSPPHTFPCAPPTHAPDIYNVQRAWEPTVHQPLLCLCISHNPDSQTAASTWNDLRYSNTIVIL